MCLRQSDLRAVSHDDLESSDEISKTIYDQFAEMLVEKVKAFKVGPGFGEGVTHGPLIHMRQADKVQEVSWRDDLS